MVSVDQILSITLACIVLIVVPGPSVMFIVGRALSYGRASALSTVAGNSLGVYTVAVLVACGVGLVLRESEAFLSALRIAGALVLIWLGYKAIRERKAIGPGLAGAGGTRDLALAARQGYWVGLTNPKALIVFAVILPQFVHPEAGHLTAQMLLLAIVPVAVGLCTDIVWALAATRARNWLSGSRRRNEAVGAVGGTLVMGLGVAMLVSNKA
ncbi:LysE family translocator [Candidimonas nitroreducens]|uniref:Lysine transporter LysE n=1 Tax=Candidimonas nitroreducens TaxID=683354 RepID=A0A225MVN0_9BURK|nr:LysE family translocator [Candidimonas nitroreducens]OWT65457.1 lysine transporter LysE [Candidimonas nitroreducens]